MTSLGETRRLLLIQSVEESDTKNAVIPDAEQLSASRSAGAPLSEKTADIEKIQFLAARADRLTSFLEPHEPAIAAIENHKPLGKYILVSATILILAIVAGFLTNQLGPEKRINILSFPLLGILIWNAIIFLIEIIRLFKSSMPFPIPARLMPTLPANEKSSPEIQQALALFQKNWLRLLAPIFTARLKTTLHLAAALLAAAAIAGMYVKGFANEYRAIFESTFFTSAESFRLVLEFLLGPASAISRIPLPDLTPLDTPAGANAAPWIHLYAITIGIFVIAPRLVFSALWKIRAVSREKNIPFRDVAPAYFDRLLAVSTGDALDIPVLAYAHDPSPASREKIQRQAEVIVAGPVKLEWLPAIPFGEEDDTLTFPQKNPADLALLFNFASTPETETHGALLTNIRTALPDTRLHILLDAETFDQKAAAFPDAENRRATRFDAWKKIVASDVHLISDV